MVDVVLVFKGIGINGLNVERIPSYLQGIDTAPQRVNSIKVQLDISQP
jgi:hypothetical protein